MTVNQLLANSTRTSSTVIVAPFNRRSKGEIPRFGPNFTTSPPELFSPFRPGKPSCHPSDSHNPHRFAINRGKTKCPVGADEQGLEEQEGTPVVFHALDGAGKGRAT